MARETSPFAQRLKALAARAGLPVDHVPGAANTPAAPSAERAVAADEQPTGDTPALTAQQAATPPDEIWTAPAAPQQPQYSYPPVPPVYGDPSAAAGAEEETGESDALSEQPAAQPAAEAEPAATAEPTPPAPNGPTLSPPVIPPRNAQASWPAPEPQSAPAHERAWPVPERQSAEDAPSVDATDDAPAAGVQHPAHPDETFPEPTAEPTGPSYAEPADAAPEAADPKAWVAPSEEPWAAEPEPAAELAAPEPEPEPEPTPAGDDSREHATSFAAIPEHLAYEHEPSPVQPAYEAPEQGAPEQHATPGYTSPDHPAAEHEPSPEQPAYAAPEQGAPVQDATPQYAEHHPTDAADTAGAAAGAAATAPGESDEQPKLIDRANAGLESAGRNVAKRFAATKASVAAARAARSQAKDEAAAAAALNAPVEAAPVLQETTPTLPSPTAPQQPGIATPAGAIPGAPEKPTFAQRAALRRRARTLRARRDAGLLELGAIVLDQRRFGDASGGQLTRRRVDELGDLDGELARIEVAIDEEHPPEALASLGIVRCLHCHALLGPRDHFCAQCGTPRPPADVGSAHDS